MRQKTLDRYAYQRDGQVEAIARRVRELHRLAIVPLPWPETKQHPLTVIASLRWATGIQTFANKSDRERGRAYLHTRGRDRTQQQDPPWFNIDIGA